MRNKISGKMITEFQFNVFTGEMICKHAFKNDKGGERIPFEPIMMAYISLGAALSEEYQRSRYGITNEEENKKVMERIEKEFQEEEED